MNSTSFSHEALSLSGGKQLEYTTMSNILPSQSGHLNINPINANPNNAPAQVSRETISLRDRIIAGIATATLLLVIAIYSTWRINADLRSCNSPDGYFLMHRMDNKATLIQGCFPFGEKIIKEVQNVTINRTYFPTNLNANIDGKVVPVFEEWLDREKEIKLINFIQMNDKQQQGVIVTFGLQEIVKSYGESFFDRLKQLDKKTLESFNCAELRVYESSLKHGMMNDEEFEKLTLKELQTLSQDQNEHILLRLNKFKNTTSNISWEQNILDLPLVKLRSLAISEIKKQFDQIPEYVFKFLSESQLKDLDFSNPT